VLACFAAAVYAWGFGFYGQSVYLAELQRLRGWPAAAVSGAGTLFYLAGAPALAGVHAAFARLGPRAVLAGGTALLGLGASAFANAAAPWQLYAAAPVMALGWAGCSAAAIAAALAPLFDRRRGLAVSLALNGASAAGFTVAPALALLADRLGLGPAVPIAALALLLVLLPLLAAGFPCHRGGRGPATRDAGPGSGAPGPPPWEAAPAARDVLRVPRFWTVAGPYALALTAQVGLVVHLVAFLRPALGAAGAAAALSAVGAAAMAGRLGLGLVVDRLDPRRASAAGYALQAGALGLMLARPGEPWALHAGCALFGLAVGNVITLPALVVQREWPAGVFGLVLGLATAAAQLAFAWGPALLGALRDAAGGYGPALGLCAALQLAAAALVLAGRPRAR
jgi:predicted MFS family arabinose efflux permease